MHKKLVASLALAGIVAVSSQHLNAALRTSSEAVSAQATDRSAWQSDPALSGALGGEIQVENYTFRLPLGYHEVQLSAATISQYTQSADSKLHIYETAITPGGVTHVIVVGVIASPNIEAPSLVLDTSIDGGMQYNKQRWTGYVQTATDSGQLDDYPFDRVYFEGWAPSRMGRKAMMGMFYVGYDGQNVISVEAISGGVPDKKALAIAEASILTLHRR